MKNTETLVKPIENLSISQNSANEFVKTTENMVTNNADSTKPKPTTKIPRIPGLHNKLNNSTNLPPPKTAPTTESDQLAFKLNQELNKLESKNNARESRSSNKPPASTLGKSNDLESSKLNKTIVDNTKTSLKTQPKRGVSLSFTNKPSRSMSINTIDGKDDMSDCKSVTDSAKRVIRMVRHKPKESQVKIFHQKVELKNVTSKIGSLEKAADYVPGGGNVKIETKQLNWNAQSKIGSLEKAAEYVPAGGNVKIESRKLNWNAKSKIGSLEKANYQPKGGNVKIESHKLDFKQKARPKTDTGLIVIEINPNSLQVSNNPSHSNSSENIDDESQQISPQSS